MKVLKLIVILLLIYVLGQLLYSGYFLWQSSRLVKITYTGSTKLGHGSPLRLLVAGDSLGAGIGASSFKASLAGRLTAELAKDHTVTLENLSRSGTKMSQLLNLPVPKQHQAIILLVISSNDLLHSTGLKAFESSTGQVLQKFSPLADQVIVIGPGNVGGSDLIPLAAWPYYRWRRPQYAGILQLAASQLPNVTYINPVNQPASFIKNYNSSTTSTDHFHLNDEGYRWWADLVIKALDPKTLKPSQ